MLFTKLSTMILVLFLCFIGISADAPVARTAAGVSDEDEDDDDDEIKFISVTEGANLSLSIRLSTADTDPQVLVTRLTNSSEEPIAQFMCYDGDCSRDFFNFTSGASMMFDGQNVTLVLMNVTQTHTGVYKASDLSSARMKSRIYSLTVIKAPVAVLSPEPPSSGPSSEALTAGGITAAVVGVLVFIAGVTAAVYCLLCRKSPFDKVSQRDSADSSPCGSQQGIV